MKKVLLLIFVIAATLSALAACGVGDTGITPDITLSSDGADAGEDVLEDPLIPEIDDHVGNLSEDYNFKGQSFTWIGSGYQAPEREEELGDVQSDALYFRQREIEELFEIDWTNYTPGQTDDPGVDVIVEAVKQDVLAGTGAYDAGYGMTHTTHPLLTNDCLIDTSDFYVVDLDRPWWPKSLRESYSIGGALYFLNGPILSPYYQDAASVVFNKVVAENYGITGLYDIVRNGEWTFDKMFEIASAVPTNGNGSGAYRYGDPDAVSTIIAHGLTITKFDEYGNPYLEETLSQELSDLADKFCRIYGDDTQTVNCKSGASGGSHESLEEKYGYEMYEDMFADDRILFLFIPTDEAAWLRIHEVEFGILPVPKADVKQENYISYATPQSSFNVFVPKSTKSTEVTDVILEAMAALGYKYFKPVFYDTMLKTRMTYDYDSKDMVDIIFNTKRYDLIDVLDYGITINGPGSMVTLIDGMVNESSEGFASRYFLQSKIVNSNIKKILANIEADRN